MLAIPVVEVKAGRCVHTHSESSRQKVIMDDPIVVCNELVEQGASQIQIVDVDAIRNRQPEHLSLLGKMKQQFPGIKFQVTAGVASSDDIQIWLDAGADWITVGGRLMRQQEKLELILVENGANLIVALDVKAASWQQGYSPIPNVPFDEWAQMLIDEAVAALMFTEIPAEGHVNGHSLMSAGILASQIQLPVIAHGGVLSRSDLLSLSGPGFTRLHGVTMGKPLFEGVFTYNEAQRLLKS